TAGSMFQAARDDAEQQICDNLEKKVDEFLDLENYDWLLVEPSGQASSFVTDMLSYLSGVLTSLEQLPTRARYVVLQYLLVVFNTSIRYNYARRQ
ncbi:jg25776, partial [Pararge aegeria aegeria]